MNNNKAHDPSVDVEKIMTENKPKKQNNEEFHFEDIVLAIEKVDPNKKPAAKPVAQKAVAKTAENKPTAKPVEKEQPKKEVETKPVKNVTPEPTVVKTEEPKPVEEPDVKEPVVTEKKEEVKPASAENENKIAKKEKKKNKTKKEKKPKEKIKKEKQPKKITTTLKKPFVWIPVLAIVAVLAFVTIGNNIGGNSDTESGPVELPEVNFSENWTPTDETYKEYEYIITVENNGDKEYYVRIDLETGIEGDEEAEWIKEHLNDSWKQSGEYFYYEKPLSPGEKSKPLLNAAYTNDTFLIKEYDATIYLADTGYESARGYDSAEDAFKEKK